MEARPEITEKTGSKYAMTGPNICRRLEDTFIERLEEIFIWRLEEQRFA